VASRRLFGITAAELIKIEDKKTTTTTIEKGQERAPLYHFHLKHWMCGRDFCCRDNFGQHYE
jgi:hypothetical protein